MGDRLFKRVCRITVAGVQIAGDFRVQFKIHKSHSKEPNTCELEIYNLNAQNRAAIQGKGQRVIVEAGYGDQLAQIFSGESSIADHTHAGATWITKVQCNNGERVYRFTNVDGSHAKGTTLADVFAALGKATGLDTRKAEAVVRQATSRQFPKGYAYQGRVSTELDKLLNGRGLEWSIQDDQLQVTETGKAVDGEIIDLSSATGLIGSPEHGSPEKGALPGETPAQKKKKPQVLKVKSLLQPSIRPAGKVKLSSAAIKGTLRVLTVDHTGDTFEGPWYTEIEAVPV